MTTIEKRYKIIEQLFKIEDIVILDQIEVLISLSKAEITDPLEFTEEQEKSVQRGLDDLDEGRQLSAAEFQKEKNTLLRKLAEKTK